MNEIFKISISLQIVLRKVRTIGVTSPFVCLCKYCACKSKKTQYACPGLL